jgi:protein-S-isoprenylcysteine O-methyltransferase Ste14
VSVAESGSSTRGLASKTLIGFAELLLVFGIALFGGAGTFDYWQAWLFIVVFAASAGLITAYLWRNSPALLARRVRAGPTAETAPLQRFIQGLASLAFIGILVVPALDHRFGWSSVPVGGVILGDVLIGLGFWCVFRVFKENAFTAATIEVAADQKVISTGPYALVRHPMYAGAFVLLIGMPLALGSAWGLLLFVAIALVIVWRLLDEEDFLVRNLPGYAAYRQQVRYRLIPRVW